MENDFEMMDYSHEMDFDQWFDVFTDYCIRNGYRGPIDKESFRDGFEDMEPEDSAHEYLQEMQG